MKYIAILMIIALFASPAFSQKKKKKSKGKDSPTWFFADIGGGYGNAMWLNNNGKVDKRVELSPFNPSYAYGLKIGANFGIGAGVAIEFGKSGHRLSYEYGDTSATTMTPGSANISTFDITILARKVGETGGFFEIGPQFSTIKSTVLSTDGVNNQFNTGLTSIIFGFGGPIYYHEKFDINAGARFGFALSNVMMDGHYPYANPMYSPDYTTDADTKIFFAQIRIGFCYHIGYFQKAKCDGHIEFLGF